MRRAWLALGVSLAAVGTPPARGQCYPWELAKLVVSDAAANDNLGQRIAISGDTALAAAAGRDLPAGINAGAAYVFVQAAGVWVQQAMLTAADAAAGDCFGTAVAVSGDTAVIGASAKHLGTINDAGAAYMFVRSGDVWTQQARLTAADAAAGDYFGGAAAVDGDTAAIGADWSDQAAKANAGAAYVFVRSAGVWLQQAKLIAGDAAASDSFGYALALDGDTVVVGAPYSDRAGAADAGAAYVFVRAGDVWTQQAKLTASDAAYADAFGYAVAADGDRVVVGAPYVDRAGAADAGAAYVFVRAGDVWTQQAKLTAADAAPLDRFGNSVALAGDTALIGACYDDHPGGTDAGAAYVFVDSRGVWTQQAKFTAADAAAGDSFGSVALAGSTAVVGAWRDDRAGATDAGAVYVFHLNCAFPGDLNCDEAVDFDDIVPFVLAIVSQAGYEAHFPHCRWLNADVNGDGSVDFDDINPFVPCLVAGRCP